MTDPSDWHGPIHRTAQAAVAQQLRQDILSGRMPPGTRLIQSEVATRLGMSTTPVREAMRELAAEGLLDGDPHKGLFVHNPSLDEFVEVYEIRLLLEPVNIRKTAERISDEALSSAQALVDRMDSYDDLAGWVEANTRFHTIITEASQSSRLIEILRNLRNISSLYVGIFAQQTPERLSAANDEHRAILDACRRRDPDTAAEMVHRHVLESLQILQGVLAESDGHGGTPVQPGPLGIPASSLGDRAE